MEALFGIILCKKPHILLKLGCTEHTEYFFLDIFADGAVLLDCVHVGATLSKWVIYTEGSKTPKWQWSCKEHWVVLASTSFSQASHGHCPLSNWYACLSNICNQSSKIALKSFFKTLNVTVTGLLTAIQLQKKGKKKKGPLLDYFEDRP